MTIVSQRSITDRTTYVPHTDNDRKAMLDAIGVQDIDSLFVDIPAGLRNPDLNLPPGVTEMEVLAELSALAERNQRVDRMPSFLGGGAYHHFIPSAVWQLASRSEFYTAYTAYQPEVSQGTLQSMYEFQTFVTMLTGMEVANSGVYDGASGLAEASLMAVRVTGRPRVAVANSVHPDAIATLETYLIPQGIHLDVFDPASPPDASTVACFAIQQPAYDGFLVPAKKIGEIAHAGGALFVVSVEPLSLGLLKTPAEYGADIVVGDGQSLGVPLNYGGPSVGIFACREKYIRQLPGRVVGATTDSQGRRGFVLTLQTREQHIRREKATSNICTSTGLIALATTIYLSLLGKQGLRQVADLCYQKAHFAAKLLTEIPGVSLVSDAPFFCEFTLQTPVAPAALNAKLLDQGILGGLDISSLHKNGWLVCCTETTSRADIEQLASAVRAIVEAQ